MSRAPPFPTRHRSPSVSGSTISSPTLSGTRPLQISRPVPERSTIPNNGAISPLSPRVASSNGPSRPQRSELRVQASDYDSMGQTTFRDSNSTTHSDLSFSQRSYVESLYPNTPANPKPKPQRLHSPIDEGDLSTPTSLASAMSAFKSAGSRRRAMTDESEEMEYQVDRHNNIEAEKARQQRIRDKAPGRQANGRARAGDIDAVLEQVRDEWEFIIDPDFNGVDLALQLLDQSSLGKDMNSFQKTMDMLGKALKGSVDRHYQAFAASLPHQAALLGHLSETQTQIHTSRTSLLESKETLGNQRADLVQLWSRGQTLEEMLRLLDQIEHLKSVPDLLETLMSEKRLLQAAVLLVRSLKLINKPDMLEIGAVSDLRSYLLGQDTALRDILIDELQNHLYLKSFWCDNRWAAYVPNQQTFRRVEFEVEGDSQNITMAGSSPTSSSYITNRLNELAIKPNEPPIDLTDLTLNSTNQSLSSGLAPTSNPTLQNPEVDSFSYMEILIESLAVLGKLGSALDTIAQRLPGEIFNLVETTLSEVQERAEFGHASAAFGFGGSVIDKTNGAYIFASENLSMSSITMPKATVLPASSLRLTALESSSKRADHEILKDLFWTLYSKLDAVAQGLRVIYEVSNRVGSRRDFKDSSGSKPGSLFPLSEVWGAVQLEVRTLISDYLANEDQSSISSRNPISSINEILREGKFSREKIKGIFRFADTDVKAINKTLKPHEDGLTRVLNDTMPGLVQGSGDMVQATLASVGTDDRILGTDQHHRLLLRPDAFHVSVLFQPTLAFLSRIAAVLPFGVESERTSSAVLDDFVLKVYLPQLEEKVSDLFHRSVTGPEAFQPDPSSHLMSTEPLAKASTELMALINSLCVMLSTSPFHRENYSRLILGVIIQFYQRCSDRFQDLVTVQGSTETKLEPRLALAAQWAQKPEVSACVSELLYTSKADQSKLQQLLRHETNLELELLGHQAISRTDLIVSTRNTAALAVLYRSVSWFVTGLNALKARSDDAVISATPQNLEPLSGVTPYTSDIPSILPQEQLMLPLSREMSLRFQALLKTYEQLSSLILDTIRLDIRCRTISYLDSSIRQGNNTINDEVLEPDTYIEALNTDLVKCGDVFSTCLPRQEHWFVLAGVGHLMEHLLISRARRLRLPTRQGIQKILRNMLAVQQCIKALAEDHDQQNAMFQRAKQYYSLFFSTPRDMLDGARRIKAFSFDEYQAMLKLQCGIDVEEGDAGIAKALDRNYSSYVIELHGLELENSTQ